MDSHGQFHLSHGTVDWTDSGTSLVRMSSGHPMDIHWTGRIIPSGQRILVVNLDTSVTLFGGYM